MQKNDDRAYARRQIGTHLRHADPAENRGQRGEQGGAESEGFPTEIHRRHLLRTTRGALAATGRRFIQPEKVAISIDMRGQIERVLAREPLGQFGIALLERLDNLQVIDDRARRPIILHYGRAADRAHVGKQIACRIDDCLRAPERNDRGMERDVCIRVFAQML